MNKILNASDVMPEMKRNYLLTTLTHLKIARDQFINSRRRDF